MSIIETVIAFYQDLFAQLAHMVTQVSFFLWTHPLAILVTMLVTAAVAVLVVSNEGEKS